MRRSIQLQHKNYLTNILNSNSNLKGNKPFWKFIKSQRRDHTGISALEIPDGTATTMASKAEALEGTFQSAFTVEDLTSLPTLSEAIHPSIEEITITAPGVFALLSQTDPHKAGSPDNIPVQVLRELATELTPMLTHLFRQSLNTGEIPQEWKSAFVTPIFKKGSRHNPSNYHSVSLTSIVCKTLEHISVSHIVKHLETHYVLCNNQFGFNLELETRMNHNYC